MPLTFRAACILAQHRHTRSGFVNRKWFLPGMAVKRWLALLFIGITLGALGVAFVLREARQEAKGDRR